MHSFKEVKQKILEANNIAIAGHINPDGDSIGSLLSLGLGLERLGKKVYMISKDKVPKAYRHLPGTNRIVKKITKNIDLAIAVDCSNKEILGKTYEIFKKAKLILEIDHHEFRRPFGNIALIDTQAAAVGELIFLLLKRLKINITKEIAQNLLTSIIVETNSFRLPNVRPFTFEVCTKLIKMDIDFHNLVEMVYWSKTKEAALLSGLCLARCKFVKKGKIVWSIVRKRDFDEVKGRDEDVDAVIEQMRSIQGVQLAVLFREKSRDILRVSLRSRGKVNVAKVAESFGGGGHFDVAGCNISNSAKAKKELLSRMKDLLQ
jgi:phosphoesterase RecJ-like protein